MKFCFLCGKKTEKLIKGYCEECYNEKFQLIKIPEKISLTICVKCNLIKYKNKWKSIKDVIRNKIEVVGKNVGIEIEENDVISIHASGFLKDSKKPKEEIHEIKLKLRKTVCLSCSRKYGDYYEAILQLRGKISNDIIDFIDDQVIIKKSFYRAENVKGGLNLYLKNKSLANKIANDLKEKYNAEIKKSFKLVTKKEGRNIYRNVILIRI